ncbi:unnamed protein product, partial [Staurois parvus]
KRRIFRARLNRLGLLGDYLKKHHYNPATKYFPSLAQASGEPLQNYMDVSKQLIFSMQHFLNIFVSKTT